MVASNGVLFEGYRHERHGICLGDGQTEAVGVPSQGGRGDALLVVLTDSEKPVGLTEVRTRDILAQIQFFYTTLTRQIMKTAL